MDRGTVGEFKSFSEWFEAQHGSEPDYGMTLGELRKEVESRYQHYLVAKGWLSNLEEWQSCRTAALLAWQARERAAVAE